MESAYRFIQIVTVPDSGFFALASPLYAPYGPPPFAMR